MVTPIQPCQIEAEAQTSSVTLALSRHADGYWERFGSDPVIDRVLRRLLACRTGELGVHACVCEDCGWSGMVGNSCGDRHCPQCQGQATAKWLEDRQERMLAVPHFQVVFTLPAELRAVARCNQKFVYGLLFRAGSSVLQDLGAQRLGAKLGITAALHTWTSEMAYHPHVHCIVTAGGLALDGERLVDSRKDYLFPERIMGAMFRGRFLEGLIKALDAKELVLPGEKVAAEKTFRSLVRVMSKRHKRWVVHVDPPNGRPVEHITKYLARYVKGIAISDSRILSVTDAEVTIRTKTGVLSLEGPEFVRRFTLHILPPRLRKVRHFGLYGPGGCKVRLALARAKLLNLSPAPEPEGALVEGAVEAEPSTNKRGICPCCGERSLIRILVDRMSRPAPAARGSP